jgi:hypothetical protein
MERGINIKSSNLRKMFLRKTIAAISIITMAIGCVAGQALGQGSPEAVGQGSPEDLRVILIRHAEKPKKGDNLDCQGLNRSLALPAMLVGKFGIPAFTYIPAIGLGDSTKHSRMFQTIIPFAVKYNLALNSVFTEGDSTGIARDILRKKGTVLIVWEHKRIVSIARALGIREEPLKWDDDDYDSIWLIRVAQGAVSMTRASEGLKPPAACPF